MDVRLPNGLLIKNIPEGTTQEDLLATLSAAGHDVSSVYKAMPKPQMRNVSGPEAFRDAAKAEMGERSWWERGLQGVGETFDRFAFGTKGLFTDLPPEEKLRLAQNKTLSQEGGIASMVGQAIGDLAITAPLGIGAAAAGPAIAGMRVAQAAGRMLPRSVQQVAQTQAARTAGGVAGSVTGGGVTGAISDPEDRMSGAAWGIGGNLVGGLPRAVRVMRGTTGAAGAAGGAVESIARATGRGSAETAEELASRIERGAAEAEQFRVPVTAAQAAGSPELAAKELGSRAALPTEYAHHARSQNEAIYAAMERATRSAETLDDVVKARETLTAPLREAAFEAAQEWTPNLKHMIGGVLDEIKRGARAGNPNVSAVVASVEKQLNQPGGITAARLYEIEKWLRDKLHGPHALGDEMSAAVKGADAEVMKIRKGIDAVLDRATNGQWTQYKQTYAGVSRLVDDALASGDLRAAAGSQQRQLMGAVPQQTGRSLAADTARAAEGEFGSRFSATTARELNDLTNFVRRIEEPMRTLKFAGTGGGGSQTIMQGVQLAANVIGMLPMVGSTAKAGLMAVVTSMKKADQEELARLLLNPEAAVEALRRSALTNAPLSPAQQWIRQIARTSGRTEGQTGAGGRVLVQTLGGS